MAGNTSEQKATQRPEPRLEHLDRPVITRVWFKEKVSRIGQVESNQIYADNGGEAGNVELRLVSNGIERRHKMFPSIIRFIPMSNIREIEFVR